MKWREKHEGFRGQRIVVVPRPIVEKALKDPLLRTLLPTDAGYYPKATGHTIVREHGAVYGAAKKSPWTIHWFHAVGANVPLYLQRLGVTKEKPVVSLGGDVYLFSLFEEVVEALEHGFTLTHLLYAAHSLAHLMGLILRHKEQHGHGAPSVREQIAKSVEFMKGHLSEPLKVATLAALVNLSRSHYTTLFRRVTGYSPLSYLNHLRMQRAVQMLNSPDLPIKQISDQLGFSEQFYFSRAFSKMHNHSPTDHRRRYSSKALPRNRRAG